MFNNTISFQLVNGFKDTIIYLIEDIMIVNFACKTARPKLVSRGIQSVYRDSYLPKILVYLNHMNSKSQDLE